MRGRRLPHGFADHGLLLAMSMFGVFLGTPSNGQVPPAAPDQNILVEARGAQALQDFVASMTESDRSRQLARWNGEVCPAVIGIDPKQAATMEARIGKVASALHLKPRTKGCLTTMLVIVDNDAKAVTASLLKRFPITLRTDGGEKLHRFASSTQPVRWVSVTDPCGREGCVLQNSRLRSAGRPEFKAIIVVIDGQQIGRIKLAELSDYVAFVALGNPPMKKNWPSSSIMSMFDGDRTDGTVSHLTERDFAFLRGLYGSQADGRGENQRSSIFSAMKKEQLLAK